MPEEGAPFLDQAQLLSTNEIKIILRAMSDLGVKKVRFTGGEPLLRKDIIDLIKYSSQRSIFESVHITTNGLLLSNYIDELEQAGLNGINISLDTLDAEKFKKITRRDEFQKVIKGLNAAILSDIKHIKVNVVAMRDFNQNEILDFVELTKTNDITVRFIELMPFDSHQIWKTGKYYGADKILSHLRENIKRLRPISGSNTEHHIFQIDGYKGRVAVIPSFTRTLCKKCNRIRITADGKLLNCLYSKKETNIRDVIRQGLSNELIKDMIRQAMSEKMIDGWSAQRQGNDSRGSMTQIGG
tara:strand:- start:1548 stop:2444 length:897 start_codon:yes stop_codon:yes gene_type:complete